MEHNMPLMTGNTSDKNLQHYADNEVVADVLSGNTALFEILIRRYNPFLYKVGRSYGFTHHDTEDLMQEAFISSYVNLKGFTGRASFKTWLIRIMLNLCYHKKQKHSYQKEKATELLPDNSSFMHSAQHHSDNGQTVITRELRNVVETCLQTLPADYRTTFTLRELTGLSIAETAELMHTSTANVKVRLNRAKAMLRKEIEKAYSPEDIYEFNLVYCDRVVDAVMKRVHELGPIH